MSKHSSSIRPRATESGPQNVIFPPNWNCRAVPTMDGDLAGRGDRTRRVEHRRRRQPEVHVVRDVESFDAQLQTPRPARTRRS